MEKGDDTLNPLFDFNGQCKMQFRGGARARDMCRERGIQGTITVARSVSTVFFEFANSFDQSKSNSEKLIAIIN